MYTIYTYTHIYLYYVYYIYTIYTIYVYYFFYLMVPTRRLGLWYVDFIYVLFLECCCLKN